MIDRIISTDTINKQVSPHRWVHRAFLFIVLLACAAAIIVFWLHYFNLFHVNKNLTHNQLVIACFAPVLLQQHPNARVSLRLLDDEIRGDLGVR